MLNSNKMLATNTPTTKAAATKQQSMDVDATDDLFLTDLAAGIPVGSSHAERIRPADAGAALVQLNRDLAAIKKNGPPQLKDIQALAERTWRTNLAYERRIAQLAREKKQLENQLDNVWKKFDDLILPLWKFEDCMIPIYEELGAIHAGLQALARSTAVDTDARGIELRQLQDRLHDVEDKMVDGKFVPQGWSKFGGRIPGGQAMCVNLMNRCYKLVQEIIEHESVIDPSLLKLHSKLEDLVSNLSSLRDAYQNGLPADPIELQLYQEQVLAIDNLRQDGKFLNDAGEIPEGQAALHELLEWAFDLIHECIVEKEAREDDDSTVGSLTDRVDDVRSSLLVYADAATRGVTAVSYPTIKLMYDAIAEGVSTVRNTITHPTRSAYATMAKLRSLLSSSLGYVNKISAQIEPIDESLGEIYSKLVIIRRTLKNMRNQRNQMYVRARADSAQQGPGSNPSTDVARELHEFNRAYTEQLSEISGVLRRIDHARVDGQFVNADGVAPTGQVALRSLLEECFMLEIELMDDVCIA